jgi:hypothetical protein
MDIATHPVRRHSIVGMQDGADPVHALIASHAKAEHHYTAALSVFDCADLAIRKHNGAASQRLKRARQAACQRLRQASRESDASLEALLTTPPQTLAGIAAVHQYCVSVNESGQDVFEPEHWIKLVRSIALSVSTIEERMS